MIMPEYLNLIKDGRLELSELLAIIDRAVRQNVSVNSEAILIHNLKQLFDIRQKESEALEAYVFRLEEQLRIFNGLNYGNSIFMHPKSSTRGAARIDSEDDNEAVIAGISEKYAVIIAVAGLNEANGIQKRELLQKIDRNEDNIPKSRAAVFDLLRMSNES